MTKKVRTGGTAQQQHSAETVHEIIQTLKADERHKLFALLAQHPDNEPVRLLKGGLESAQSDLIRLHNELHNNDRNCGNLLAAVEGNLLLARERLDLAHGRVVESAESVERYQSGPRARADMKTRRHSLIRHLLAVGIEQPAAIRRCLEEQGGKVTLKTVQNDLSIIRNA